jgi:predicted nucleic acid-binding protein
VDASVAIKLVVGGEALRAHARQLYQDASVASALLIAPPIFESEMDSIVRARAHSGRITGEEASRLYAAIDRLAIEVRSPAGIRDRARDLAAQFQQERVYDSTYAALAEIVGCEFWTADRAFYDAVHNALDYVKYLADYPVPPRA